MPPTTALICLLVAAYSQDAELARAAIQAAAYGVAPSNFKLFLEASRDALPEEQHQWLLRELSNIYH